MDVLGPETYTGSGFHRQRFVDGEDSSYEWVVAGALQKVNGDCVRGLLFVLFRS